MARKLRVEYPGAIYHVMNRGDRREPIFRDDEDRQKFLTTLGEVRDYVWSSYTEYLKPPGKRWAWLRVDRLFGEMRIPKDSPTGRQQFAQMVEQRRGQEEERWPMESGAARVVSRRPGKGEDCSPVAARDDDDAAQFRTRFSGNRSLQIR